MTETHTQRNSNSQVKFANLVLGCLSKIQMVWSFETESKKKL